MHQKHLTTEYLRPVINNCYNAIGTADNYVDAIA